MGLNDILKQLYACLPETPFSSDASLSASTSNDGGAEDRISALPDDLLRNVVSRLTVKDAARTAVLSSRWNGIWTTTPLVLEDRYLLIQPPAGDRSALPAAVSRVLASHPGPFRWVNLSCSFMDNQEEALANWLRLFADKGVDTLVLVNCPWPLDVALPESILRCSSLRRLYLGVWLFPDTSRPTVPPRGPDVFPHLQELGICHTIMRERDVEYLLACSPELKIFALILSYGFPERVPITSHSLCCLLLWFTMAEELDIVSAPSLQRLILFWPHRGRTTRVKIGYAPKLSVLGYLDTADHVLQIGNTIIKAGVTNVTPNAVVPSVKVLALNVDFRVAEEVKTLLSFLRCFPQVETLHLKSNNGGTSHNEDENEDEEQDYKDTSGKLSSTFWQEVGPIECVESRVKKVVLDQFSMGDNEIEFLMLCKRRAKVMHKVVLVLPAGISPELLSKNLGKVYPLASTKCASGSCEFAVHTGPRCSWNYRGASDLSLSDPFPEGIVLMDRERALC
ncbi:hypothetical protein ACQ4PT_067582 [Festuca glaucescens]